MLCLQEPLLQGGVFRLLSTFVPHSACQDWTCSSAILQAVCLKLLPQCNPLHALQGAGAAAGGAAQERSGAQGGEQAGTAQVWPPHCFDGQRWPGSYKLSLVHLPVLGQQACS